MISSNRQRILLLFIANMFFGLIIVDVFLFGVLLIVGIFDQSNPIAGIILMGVFIASFFGANKRIIRGSANIALEILIIVITNVLAAILSYKTGLMTIIGELFELFF